MGTHLASAARGLVDAFNVADWEGCKAILTEDSVYDEVGTSRCLAGYGEIIPALQGWREGMPDFLGRLAPSPQRESTKPPGRRGFWTSMAVGAYSGEVER